MLKERILHKHSLMRVDIQFDGALPKKLSKIKILRSLSFSFFILCVGINSMCVLDYTSIETAPACTPYSKRLV